MWIRFDNKTKEMADRLGISVSDLMDNALTLLDWSMKASEEGKSIGAIDHEQKAIRIVDMPMLMQLRNE